MPAAGTARMENWSSGDLIAAAAAGGGVLAAVAKALGWLIGLVDRRMARREARLNAWEEGLQAREKAYRKQIEDELDEVRAEMAQIRREHATEIAALRDHHAQTREVLLDVTVELRVHAPRSEALSRAHKLLSLALPVDHRTPASITSLADQVAAKHVADKKE